MKVAGKLVAALLVALALGVGSAWWIVDGGLGRIGFGGAAQNGAWHTNLAIGSPAADPYIRAAVARQGLLALSKSETIYFTAFTDDSGAALKTNCAYVVSGGKLPARWWSITAYGADHYLIPNKADKYSAAMNTVTWTNERFLFTVGPEEESASAQGDFVPTGYEGGDGASFSLTLRLYNPEPEVAAAPQDLTLPTVTKERCR